MNVGLYHGVGAMMACERRLDVIAHNLANVGTPAFKRCTPATEARLVGSTSRRFPVTSTSKSIDFRQGELERTGNPYDLALLGAGWFAVEGSAGEMYTRNGSFRVDDKGVLQTVEGHMVAWSGGRGRIDPVGDPMTIDASGVVTQGEGRVGQLRVVAFDDESSLRADGHGYWRAPGDARRAPSQAEVQQGALERSNVLAVDELVELITVQRNFESASSVLDMIDQTYRRLNSAG